jgi:hypothetical protein
MNAATWNHRTIIESRSLRAIIVALLSCVLILVIGVPRTAATLRCTTCLHTPKSTSIQFSRTLRRRRETFVTIAATESSVRTDLVAGGDEKRRQLHLDNQCQVVIRLPLERRVKALNLPELAASASGKATERLSLRC